MQIPDAFEPHGASCQRIGTYQSPEFELADVLIVHLTESTFPLSPSSRNSPRRSAAQPGERPIALRPLPPLERRAGAWLRDFNTASTQPGFTIAGNLAELAGRE